MCNHASSKYWLLPVNVDERTTGKEVANAVRIGRYHAGVIIDRCVLRCQLGRYTSRLVVVEAALQAGITQRRAAERTTTTTVCRTRVADCIRHDPSPLSWRHR